MGNNIKPTHAPPPAKSKGRKKRRALVLKFSTKAEVDDPEASIFDDMSEGERMLALAYYYDHPEELPDRETPAMKQADKLPLPIKLQFDEAIFERYTCLRPIPEDELEGIDPLDDNAAEDLRAVNEMVPEGATSRRRF